MFNSCMLVVLLIFELVSARVDAFGSSPGLEAVVSSWFRLIRYVCGTCGILFDTSYPTEAKYVGIGSGDVNR